MNRRWSRAGVRTASVGLLALGLVGGVYLGQSRAVAQRSTQATQYAQVAQDDMQLLKQRQAQHAAARAWQREAEGDAAQKAADQAKLAAGRAHTLEQKVIQQAAQAAQAKAKAEQKAREEAAAENGGPVPYAGPVPASCASFSGSRKTGCSLMLAEGFKIDQFPCLDKLWKKESGWNYRAENRSSGAYGIPQALPGNQMAAEGADWKTNPATQIKWGLDYIKRRYDTPCGAWAHSEDVGWY